MFADQYGRALPDDDAGRDDARIMVHHLALISGDQHARVKSWLTVWAPWMSAEQIIALTDAVIAKPLRYRADTLGKKIGLTAEVRTRLGIKTIGACDMTKAEREAARQARKVQAKRKRRRKQGVKPRAEYVATSAERTKPWVTEGVGRRTWYRRQRAIASLPSPSTARKDQP